MNKQTGVPTLYAIGGNDVNVAYIISIDTRNVGDHFFHCETTRYE